MKPQFCPNCHRNIPLPAMLQNPNMNIGGVIKLQCGNCNPDGKGNKKGFVKIKPQQTIKEEDNGFE